MDKNSKRNQAIKRALVDREVIHCVSTVVWEISNQAESFPEYYEDLINAFRGIPDFEEAASADGWTKRNSDGVFVNHDLDKESNADTWEDLCDQEEIETFGYESEIFEHWIVSDYMATKLENYGHRVLRDFFGMTVWGRPTTGQAIFLDAVISQIAEDMEILEGQKNEWE
jgi:hypothetical protein